MATHLVVGDGPAGMAAAQAIRARDADAAITILSSDPNPHYYRAALTNYLIGQLRPDQLWAVPPGFYERMRIQRYFAQVQGVDVAGNAVLVEGGRRLSYDSLLIASGSAPAQLEVPGSDAAGVMTFRTLQDAHRVLDAVADLRQALVVGSGTLGLEWVQGLRHLGVEVTYLLRERHLLPRVLDEQASEMVLHRLRAAGVTVIVEDEVAEIRVAQRAAQPDGASSARVGQVFTKRGRQIPCQLVGVAIGVRPNVELLSGTSVDVDRGVLADRYLRTSVPNVFAAGDVAHLRDPAVGLEQAPFGLWQAARKQGQVAGVNMVGGTLETYQPGAAFQATHLYELDFAAVGRANPDGNGFETVSSQPGPGAYRKAWLEADRVIGALFIGDRRGALLFKRLIEAKVDVSSIRARLIDPHFDLVDWVRWHTPRQVRRATATGGALVGADRPGGISSSARGVLQAAAEGTLMGDGAVGLVAADRSGARLVLDEESYPLQVGRTMVLGRNAGCDIVLADQTVSSRHAEVVPVPGGYALRDLDSSNGSWVGSARVPPGTLQTLHHGDGVRLGHTFMTYLTADDITLSGELGAKAVLIWPDGRGETPIELDVTSIGRAVTNEVVVPSLAASRLHAQIVRASGGGRYIYDMGSTNGTRVNGIRIVDSHELVDGDEITIGRLTYTYRQVGRT